MVKHIIGICVIGIVTAIGGFRALNTWVDDIDSPTVDSPNEVAVIRNDAGNNSDSLISEARSDTPDDAAPDTATDNDSQPNSTSEFRQRSAETQVQHNDGLVDSLISQLKNTAAGDGSTIRAPHLQRMVSTLVAKPSIAIELLQRATTFSSSDEIETLNRVLAEAAAQSEVVAREVEDYAVTKIVSGTDVSDTNVFSIIETIGASSRQSRRLLLDRIPYLDEDHNTAAVLRAIKPYAKVSTEIPHVVNQLQSYTNHSDSTVRAAAIIAMGRWSTADDGGTVSYVEQALLDASAEVRHAAIETATRLRLQSKELKRVLLDILNNKEEQPHTRQQAFWALETHNLSDQDRHVFEKYKRDMADIVN